MVVDVGAPADWVKINVQKTVSPFMHHLLLPPKVLFFFLIFYLWLILISFDKSTMQKDCFEVYALVPGLLREEASKWIVL